MSAQGMEIKAHRILLPHTHSQRHRVGGDDKYHQEEEGKLRIFW